MHAIILGLSGLACLFPVFAKLAGSSLVEDWGPIGLTLCTLFALPLVALGVVYGLKYNGINPEGPLYRSAGIRMLWQLFLTPYTVFAGMALCVSRWVTWEPFGNEVAPRIWVGSVPLFWSRRKLEKYGCDAVLNLCFEFTDLAGLQRNGFTWKRIPWLDGMAPLEEQWQEALAWCQEQYDDGKTLFIHCAQGHGRSVTVAAMLMLSRGLAEDPEQCEALIKENRSMIHLSTAQREAVKASVNQ